MTKLKAWLGTYTDYAEIFLRHNWKLSSQSGIYKLLRLLCKHSELNSFTLCLQRKNNLKDVGVNFNLYYLRPTSILVYICILLEMLVLPVIPIFCLVVVAVNTLLPVLQSIYAEIYTSFRKLQLKSFIQNDCSLFSWVYTLNTSIRKIYNFSGVQHTKTQDYDGRLGVTHS